jgi:16S rRNA (adenine1518-N6/adenine1519-N6)-dimethyltransferase
MSVRDQLEARGIAPKKSFGQNFLVDAHALAAIADTCVPEHAGPVHTIELGAGTGVLTRALLDRGASVTAVERDRDLIPVLQEAFHAELQPEAGARLTLLEADAKAVDLAALAAAHPGVATVLAGNLPYHLTGPIVEMATNASALFSHAVFLVQREVAQRLVAPAGSKDYGVLSIFVQAAFRVTCVRDVGPSSFFPPPKVTSTIVKLVPHKPRVWEETLTFRTLVKSAFAQRRKTLRNNWHSVLAADELAHVAKTCEIDLGLRGEVLSVSTYGAAAKCLDDFRARLLEG